MYLLNENCVFPPVEKADQNGMLAFGGDLSMQRLVLAYKSGIFPWYSDGEPIIWYSPDPRMVLFPEKLKISKSMRQIQQKKLYSITFNQNFKEVISNCKSIHRGDQDGTWITNEMETAYMRLHKAGWAKSVEVWRENELVGGLYGIDLGNVFCGESMFSKESNTSKLAFIYLVEMLKTKAYNLIDCQVYNDHLASLGAEEISRQQFLTYLRS